MRLYVFVTCLIPRAVTATRPLPGANIKTCRYAAAWRYAPFLLRRISWVVESLLSRPPGAMRLSFVEDSIWGQSSSCAPIFMKCINARGAALVSVIQ